MKITIIKQTIALLSSMIRGGERHSKYSEEMVDQSLELLNQIEKETKSRNSLYYFFQE